VFTLLIMPISFSKQVPQGAFADEWLLRADEWIKRRNEVKRLKKGVFL
jgi:hypothetical protein